MRAGDLVRLKSQYGDGSFPVTIGSVSFHNMKQREIVAGNVALLLGDFKEAEHGMPGSKLILVNGELGWVWHDEIEVIK